MSLRKAKTTLFFVLFALLSFAQQTTTYTEANLAFKQGQDYYEKGLFTLAQKAFEEAIELTRPANEPELEYLKKQAELYFAKSAVRLNQPDGEKLILDFARKYTPDPIASEAIVEMGNYYFNAKEYDRVVSLFEGVDLTALTKEEQSEINFKIGYSLFVKKKFKQAKSYFETAKDNEDQYYYPNNYYLGMCHFFLDQYDQALTSFQRVSRSKKYKPHVPYYITQIYFSQTDYDDVIVYGERALKDKSIKKRANIHQLIGQAYFEKGNFEAALPNLEYYAQGASRLRKEDFYQLGYVQYKSQKYTEAIQNLSQLNRDDSQLGQHAMYLLGDAHLKTDDKEKARNAFKEASEKSFDPSIQEEALYNFAKLSYELSYDREAVSALQKIGASSPYYSDAQTILSSIFLNTRDYANAMTILEGIDNKTPRLKETYQKVAYYRGVQLFKEGNYDQAKIYFNKSLSFPIDARIRALATYWQGDIAHREKDYNTSINKLNSFATVANTLTRLPDESSLATASYTQGYNYLKKKDYVTALNYFKESIDGIRQNTRFIKNDYVTSNILGDAVLRAGDCLFKRNKYDQAIRYYDEAVQNKYKGYVYALYQKAIIEGLRRNVTEKIIALENITDNYPNSEYADNALLQLGITYQEIGKFNQAANPLRELIQNFPKSELYNQALLKLGLIAYNQGSQQTAINYYKQVFSHNPTPAEAQAALTALEEIYVDDMGKADEYFAFLETIPGYNVGNREKEQINFKAAESQYENGNYEKAIEGYNKYLRQYPNGAYSLVALYHRGESYGVLKRYSEALKDYDAVSGRGPSKYYEKALEKAAIIAYNYEKDFQKAYDYYTKLEVATDNEDMRFESQLGAMRSAYRSNNTQAVLATARKVNNNARATDEQKAVASYYIGKIALDNKQYDEALQAFNAVTRMSDNEQTAESRYLIAYIYYLRRDLDVAQQLCLNANTESSNYPYWVAKSVILLSDILAEKGDFFYARAALESLIENYDGDEELINIAKAKLQKLQQEESNNSRLQPDKVDDNILELDETDEPELPDGN